MHSADKNTYLYGVDLVRFWAAFMVMTYHLSWSRVGISGVAASGWVGVEVFFVISGLVIANSAHGSSAQRFAVSRFLRLYPGAWCAVAVSCVLIIFGHLPRKITLSNMIGSITLLHGISFVSAYWTLPIEMSFYFFIYMLLRYGWFDRFIEWIPLLLIGWSAPYQVLLVVESHSFIHWPFIYQGFGAYNMLLLRYGSYFGLGMLIWLAMKKRIGRVGVVFAGIGIASGLLEIDARAIQLAPLYAKPISGLGRDACLVFLFALGIILISALFHEKFPQNTSLRRLVRAVGLVTYPLYLIHQVTGEFGFQWAAKQKIALVPSFCIALLISVVLSFGVSIWVEPFVRGYLRVAIRKFEEAWNAKKMAHLRLESE